MSKQKHILVVEDEDKLANLLKDYLVSSQYEVSVICDGALVVDWVNQNQPDLILLDIMLPNKDGLSICRDIRKTLETPIIFLTAKVEEIDRIIGLEIGGDDYVCKPFSPREVVARVGTVLKRITKSNASQSNNKISINENTFKVTVLNKEIELTAVEFKLFKLMFNSPGRIYSRQQFMDTIYEDHRIVSSRTIDSHIKKLRQKLSVKELEKDIIFSVYGVGYKFEDID